MTQRLDIAYRVIAGVNDTLDVNYNSLGALTCTIEPGLYMSADSLCDAVQDAIDAQWSASASFEAFANADGTCTIDSTAATFAVTWGSDSLRDWLGFSGGLSGSASYTGAGMPGVWVSDMPWTDDRHGWLWSTRGVDHASQGHRVRISRRNLWSLTVHAEVGDIAQARSVLNYLMRGTPATWYRDTAVSSAFGYSNWFGRVECTIDPRRASYSDDWLNEGNLRTVWSTSLDLVEV